MTATMTPVTSDHELLRRLREHDQHALRDAYDRHGPRVIGVARRTVVDPHAAEEVAQEVFLYLWHHADRVDLDRGTIGTFLTVVARQRAVDHVRRDCRWRARQERVGTDGIDGHRAAVVDIADDVAAADASARRRAELQAALDRLPDDQRHAVVLAYFHGRSYRQVADELGLPEGTAKSRLRLAMRRLHRELACDTAVALSDDRRAS